MRGIQGLGAAITLPAALSIVMNMFPEGAERNKALGIWGAMGAMGATIGVLAGGLLTRYLGWQYIFFLNVPIGAAVLVLAPRIVPESRLRSETAALRPVRSPHDHGRTGGLGLCHLPGAASGLGCYPDRGHARQRHRLYSSRSSSSRPGSRRPCSPCDYSV